MEWQASERAEDSEFVRTYFPWIATDDILINTRGGSITAWL